MMRAAVPTDFYAKVGLGASEEKNNKRIHDALTQSNELRECEENRADFGRTTECAYSRFGSECVPIERMRIAS